MVMYTDGWEDGWRGGSCRKGWARRRKTAGLDLAPVHRPFPGHNDFPAPRGGPAGRSEAPSPGSGRPGAQGPEWLTEGGCFWDPEPVPHHLVPESLPL